MADEFKGAEATYAAETATLINYYLERDDVIDAKQTGVYSLGVVFASTDRIDVTLQWRPPGEIGETVASTPVDDAGVTVVKPVSRT